MTEEGGKKRAGREYFVGRLLAIFGQPAFQIFLFALGAIFLVWPLLGIPARSGILAVYIYLFVLWAVLIALLFLVSSSLEDGADGEGD